MRETRKVLSQKSKLLSEGEKQRNLTRRGAGREGEMAGISGLREPLCLS